MSDAKLTFTSDIKQIERDNAKLVKDNARLVESLRKVKAEGQQIGTSWQEGLKKIETANDRWAAGMTKMAPKFKTWQLSFKGVKEEQIGLLAAASAYIGPATAVAAATSAAAIAASFAKQQYAGYRQELEQSAAAHREFQQSLTKDIAVSRDAQQGAAIEKFVSSVPGIKKEDVRASLAGVTRETPTAGLDRRLEIAGQISRLAPTGQDLGELGGVAGQIADIMPGVSGKQAAQRAALLAREAGGDLRKIQKDKMQRSLQQLMAKGTPADEALAMGLAAAQGQISPETLTHIAVGGRMSKDQQLEKSRLQAAMPANLKMVQGLNAGQDIIGGIVSGMESTSAGRGARARYRFGEQRESQASLETRREELFLQMDEFIRAQHAGKGVVGRAISETSIAGAQVGRTMLGPANEGQVRGLEMIVDRLRQSLEKNAAATEAANRQRGAVNVDRHVD